MNKGENLTYVDLVKLNPTVCLIAKFITAYLDLKYNTVRKGNNDKLIFCN